MFGIKGGATGGGYAQIVPMEDINLHFTGDFHAIGAANNLLAALLDNHIQQGNALGIDPKQITWKRCVDMNDRQLRHVVDGLGGRANGCPREDGFDITVASEIMAVFCLAESLSDLRARLGRIIVGYTYDGAPVTAHDLRAEGAMTALLRDALCPNLVQTLEGTPAFVHGGPFANIAHGCNSVLATRMAQKNSRTIPSPRRASPPISARRSSLTSSAVWQICAPTPSWWRRCARSNTTAARRRTRSARKISKRLKRAFRISCAMRTILRMYLAFRASWR